MLEKRVRTLEAQVSTLRLGLLIVTIGYGICFIVMEMYK